MSPRKVLRFFRTHFHAESRDFREPSLVISAALALSPYPIPSEMPAPSAMIFFSASSDFCAGHIAGCVNPKTVCHKEILDKDSRFFLFGAAAVSIVGRAFASSSAWEGPDSTAYRTSGRICAAI